MEFVEETRFGVWFLGTETWRVHVLGRAIKDLQRMLPGAPHFDSLLDVGSGHGHSLLALAQAFGPRRIVAIDAAPEARQWAEANIARCSSQVDFRLAHAAATGLPDASVDAVFCHQTLHHIVEQEQALAEWFRVLKPGGVLMLAESTRAYIHSWMIRLLFRHPMHVQRSAEEYIAMVRHAGFSVPDAQISLPYLWWSRNDLGMKEWMGFPLPNPREETLVNLVAIKR